MTKGTSVERTQVHDFLPQLDAEAIADRGLALLDQRADVARGRRSVVDDEVTVHRRDAGAADRGALESREIDERTGGPRNAVRHDVASALRVLKHAAPPPRVHPLPPFSQPHRFPP